MTAVLSVGRCHTDPARARAVTGGPRALSRLDRLPCAVAQFPSSPTTQECAAPLRPFTSSDCYSSSYSGPMTLSYTLSYTFPVISLSLVAFSPTLDSHIFISSGYVMYSVMSNSA